MAIPRTPARLGRIRLGATRLGAGIGSILSPPPGGPPPPVTLPIFEDFESGAMLSDAGPADGTGTAGAGVSSVGATVASPLTTSFTQVLSGGAMLASFVGVHQATGVQALSLVGGAGGGRWLGSWHVRGREFFARAYLFMPSANFGGGFILGSVGTPDGTLAEIEISDTRTLRLIDRLGYVVAESTDLIPLDTLVRVEWHFVHSGGIAPDADFDGPLDFDDPFTDFDAGTAEGPNGEVRAWTVNPHSPATANIIISAEVDFGTEGEMDYAFGVDYAVGPVSAIVDAVGLRDDRWCGPAISSIPTGLGHLLGDYRYRLYVRSPDLKRLGEIDDFDSASYALRYNAVGGFVVTVPTDSEAADLLSGDRVGVEITRYGDPLIAGPVRHRARSWDKDQNPGGSLEVSGPDDLCWIADRSAVPDPTLLGPPYDTVIYDTQTGAAETVIHHYVDANAGPGATGDRVVPGLTLAVDAGLGASVFGRARFVNLLNLISALALVGGDLGFRVQQVGSGLVFSVFTPVDRTKDVGFSIRRENVLNILHEITGPEANYIIAGGDGSGLSRVFRQFGDGPSMAAYGRIEDFLDSRGTVSIPELNQAITDELAARATQEQITVTATDTEAIAFGRDYNLGDKVSAIAGAVRITDLIREIDVTLDSQNGETVQVTVGSPGATAPSEIDALIGGPVRALKQRLGRLERSS